MEGDPRSCPGLVPVLILALVLRLAVVATFFDARRAGETFEHGEIARNLVEGRGFTVRFLGAEGPTSQQAPLYPGLLALFFAAFGTDSAAAILALEIVQCFAGTALVACTAWLARSCFPRCAGAPFWAGLAAAVYPPHVYMVTHVQVAVWAALLLTLVLALAAASSSTRGRIRAVALGAAAGALVLVDPILVLALPFAAVLQWQSMASTAAPRRAVHRARVAGALLAAATACAVVTPWIWRNFRVHGEFVFVKSSFGYAFWQGNNPQSWGTDKIPKPSAEAIRVDHDGTPVDVNRALWEARHETLYIDDVLLKPAGYAGLANLSEPARSRRLGAQAWRFVRNDPGAYLRLCARRLRYFLLFDETNPKAAHPLYRASTVAWLALTAWGLIVARREWRRVWPLVGAFAAVSLFHALTITSARFRLPLEPMTLAWSSAALARCAKRVRLLFRRESGKAVSGQA